MPYIRGRILNALLIVALALTTAGALYLFIEAPSDSFESASAREWYWWNKLRLEQHIGKNACRADTGAYEGIITNVFYHPVGKQRWKEERRLAYEGRWFYAIAHPRTSPSRVSGTAGPARNWHATRDKCRDRR